MTFNVQKFHFDTQIFKKFPYRGRGNSPTLPCSVALLLRIGPSFTNPVYTAVTSITKASLKGPCPLHPPLIGVNELKKGGIRELVICNVCYLSCLVLSATAQIASRVAIDVQTIMHAGFNLNLNTSKQKLKVASVGSRFNTWRKRVPDWYSSWI